MSKKSNEFTIGSPTTHDLLMIACGNISRFVLERHVGSDLNQEAFLMLGQPVALALRSLIKDAPDDRNDDLVRAVQLTVASLPTQDEAEWDDLALEELMILVACHTQTAWRKVCSGSFSDPEQNQHYLYLPLVFQKWKTAKQYIKPVQKIFARLGQIVAMEDLRKAFYNVVAQQLLQFGISDAYNAVQMAQQVAFVDAQYSDLSSSQRAYFLYGRVVHSQLPQQFEQFGFSTLEKMRAFASTFCDMNCKVSRLQLAETLSDIYES